VAKSDNMEIVRRMIEAISGRDIDALLAGTDPEFELTPLTSTWPEPYHGHDGLRRWLSDTAATWDRFELDVEEMRELDGETVLAVVHWRGRPRGADDELDGPAAGVWRVRGGLAVSATLYPDEHRALEGFGRSAGD
jgi:ketosteroid isomerase-like protein